MVPSLLLSLSPLVPLFPPSNLVFHPFFSPELILFPHPSLFLCSFLPPCLPCFLSFWPSVFLFYFLLSSLYLFCKSFLSILTLSLFFYTSFPFLFSTSSFAAPFLSLISLCLLFLFHSFLFPFPLFSFPSIPLLQLCSSLGLPPSLYFYIPFPNIFFTSLPLPSTFPFFFFCPPFLSSFPPLVPFLFSDTFSVSVFALGLLLSVACSGINQWRLSEASSRLI